MIRAVLFDRDGTLIADDPSGARAVELMPYAREAINLLRSKGVRVGVVTNQPAARDGDLQRVHGEIEDALGAFDGWFVCRHAVAAACECRKPQPGLVLQAAQAFGIEPRECAVIGDIGSDVEAAQRAGACAVLVPTDKTLHPEILNAPAVSANLLHAVERVL